MKALFVGKGLSAQTFYRCKLPAEALGHDWVAALGGPKTLALVNGNVDSIDHGRYDVIVLSSPHSTPWGDWIEEVQASGTRVLIDVDDYLRGVHEIEGHAAAKAFGPDFIEGYYEAIEMADGVITTTGRLVDHYSEHNDYVWACANGLDPDRFGWSRPPRATINVGWSGASGHADALRPWFGPICEVMAKHKNVRFVSLGERICGSFERRFPGRTLEIPWLDLTQHPAALAQLDIAIAPAGPSAWARGHSDLRWLEASLAGAATVADPGVYKSIDHGETGLHARDPAHAGRLIEHLVADPVERGRIAANARSFVSAYRTFPSAAMPWKRALTQACDRTLTKVAG